MTRRRILCRTRPSPILGGDRQPPQVSAGRQDERRQPPRRRCAQTASTTARPPCKLTATTSAATTISACASCRRNLGLPLDNDEKTDTAHNPHDRPRPPWRRGTRRRLARLRAPARCARRRRARWVEEAEALPRPTCAGNYQAADSAGKGDGCDYSWTNVQFAGIRRGRHRQDDGAYQRPATTACSARREADAPRPRALPLDVGN
jgi:hypothetical protein